MFRVLNALDLVHFIMGHHKLVQPKMGGQLGGRARARGAAAPPPAPHLEPPMVMGRVKKFGSTSNSDTERCAVFPRQLSLLSTCQKGLVKIDLG